MKRRLVLQGLLAAMPAAGAFSALLALPKQAEALGGTLPDLDQPAPDFALAGFLPPGTEGELRLSDFQGRWLAFPLLSDPGGLVSRSYGSWISPYSQRHSFLIDPDGVLRQRWVAVRPSGHSQEILASLQSLVAAAPSLPSPSISS